MPAGAIDDQLAHGLAMIDGDRFARGEPALGLVRIELAGAGLHATAARGSESPTRAPASTSARARTFPHGCDGRAR